MYLLLFTRAADNDASSDVAFEDHGIVSHVAGPLLEASASGLIDTLF